MGRKRGVHKPGDGKSVNADIKASMEELSVDGNRLVDTCIYAKCQ